eukprot:1578573-Amphidinium_carterae.1
MDFAASAASTSLGDYLHHESHMQPIPAPPSLSPLSRLSSSWSGSFSIDPCRRVNHDGVYDASNSEIGTDKVPPAYKGAFEYNCPARGTVNVSPCMASTKRAQCA